MIKFILVGIFLHNLFAITGIELATLVDDRESPKDMKSNMSMVLTNKNGKVRTSEIRSYSTDGNKKQILWFLAPADDKGVAYLKIEHEDKNDDMKLWLPNFKKIRRISSRKKSESFMGSDMSYEDMTSRNMDEYTYSITGTEFINNQDCHILESVPNGIKTEYSKHISWITKDTYLPLKEESFDKNGNLLKSKSIIYQQVKAYNIMKELHVKNVQRNHQTVLKFDNIEVDTEIKDNIFHEKNLKRMPK
ncbi:MAG: outer membrane lipoprotein-sorting protein [Candidatus Marinimicrobia bacterium]|nr:outer membrane lipoprotein-sorting protein [Candidatus Neomarinimicrobiota bacterium]